MNKATDVSTIVAQLFVDFASKTCARNRCKPLTAFQPKHPPKQNSPSQIYLQCQRVDALQNPSQFPGHQNNAILKVACNKMCERDEKHSLAHQGNYSETQPHRECHVSAVHPNLCHELWKSAAHMINTVGSKPVLSVLLYPQVPPRPYHFPAQLSHLRTMSLVCLPPNHKDSFTINTNLKKIRFFSFV